MSDYQTQHEHNKADALAEMRGHAMCISIVVEHLINGVDNVISMDDLDAVNDAVEQIKLLTEYDFVNEDDKLFEYNFKYEVTEFLNDNLGYAWEEK